MHEEINPWIVEQKQFLLSWNWVHFVPIFLKLFSEHFFLSIRLIGSAEVKMLLLCRVLIFHAFL